MFNKIISNALKINENKDIWDPSSFWNNNYSTNNAESASNFCDFSDFSNFQNK